MYTGLQVKYVIFVQFKKKGIVSNLCKNPQSTDSTKVCPMAAMLFHADITEKQSEQSFLANCCMKVHFPASCEFYTDFKLPL